MYIVLEIECRKYRYEMLEKEDFPVTFEALEYLLEKGIVLHKGDEFIIDEDDIKNYPFKDHPEFNKVKSMQPQEFANKVLGLKSRNAKIKKVHIAPFGGEKIQLTYHI